MESFETFRKLGSYERMNLLQKEPSRFNANVRVVKYKITVEQIDEPLDVIQARIKKLWDECDNRNDRPALKEVAKKYNMDLE